MIEEKKKGIHPIVGIILMISMVLILAAIIAAFVFGTAGTVGSRKYDVVIHEVPENQIMVRSFNISSKESISGISIAIYEHGMNRLLEGPIISNKSGIAILNIPDGFESIYDVVATDGYTQTTKTIDHRPITIKISEFLGAFGIAIVGIIISFFLGMTVERYRANRDSK